MHRRHAPALIPILGLVAVLTTQGCAQKAAEEAKEHTVKKVPAEPPIPTEETKAEKVPEAISETKDEFERTLKRSLDALEEEVRALKTKAATLQESAKAQWVETLADLDTKRKATESKLDELRKSTGDAWEHLRDGAKSAWKELEDAVRKAQDEF